MRKSEKNPACVQTPRNQDASGMEGGISTEKEKQNSQTKETSEKKNECCGLKIRSQGDAYQIRINQEKFTRFFFDCDF